MFKTFNRARLTGLAASILAAGCAVAPGSSSDEASASNESPITGANVQAIDTRFPAVVNLWSTGPTGGANCTGTLIGPRTILTAAHCVIATGGVQLCNSQGLPMVDPSKMSIDVRVIPGGAANDWNRDVTVYSVDRAFVHPSAVNAPAGCVPGTLANADMSQLNADHDQAILHLAVAPGQREPSSIVTPMTVITDVSNGVYSPYGLHVALDPNVTFAPGTDGTPWIAGFGVDDRGPGGQWNLLERHAAATAFYPSTIIPTIDVKNDNPANGWVDHGDSGSGLIYQAGSRDPGLAAGGYYVIGDLFGYGGLGNGSQQFQVTFGHSTDLGWMNHGTFVEVAQWATRGAQGASGGVQWTPVSRYNDEPIPANAFIGGSDSNGAALPVCRTWFQGGMLSGKVVSNACKTPWGGAERNQFAFETLSVTHGSVWTSAANGALPQLSGYSPVFVGTEPNGGAVYVCRAPYQGGTHPGKLAGYACRIGWGGQEIDVTSYQVLLVSNN